MSNEQRLLPLFEEIQSIIQNAVDQVDEEWRTEISQIDQNYQQEILERELEIEHLSEQLELCEREVERIHMRAHEWLDELIRNSPELALTSNDEYIRTYAKRILEEETSA